MNANIMNTMNYDTRPVLCSLEVSCPCLDQDVQFEVRLPDWIEGHKTLKSQNAKDQIYSYGYNAFLQYPII